MKVCRRCHTEKQLSEFFKQPRNKGGYHHACKCCMKAINKDWCRNNPERVRELSRKNRERHLETARARSREHMRKKASEPGFNEYRNQKERSGRERLLDNYIKSMLVQNSTISRQDIPKELIELKRQQILIRRSVNELETTIKEKRDER